MADDGDDENDPQPLLPLARPLIANADRTVLNRTLRERQAEQKAQQQTATATPLPVNEEFAKLCLQMHGVDASDSESEESDYDDRKKPRKQQKKRAKANASGKDEMDTVRRKRQRS